MLSVVAVTPPMPLSTASAGCPLGPSHPGGEKSSQRYDGAIRIAVRHRIHEQDDIVAVIVGAARRCFHAGARSDARQQDLDYAALTQW
jgi:hypothetical protein